MWYYALHFKIIMNEQHSILEYGVQLLKDRNINYWLDCGTLLGIVRDQSLLPWDKDLDISILKKDLSESDIANIVIKSRSDGYEVNVYESCISITNKEYVFDIKLFDKRKDYLVEKKMQPKNSFSNAIWFIAHCLSSKYGAYRQGRNSLNQIMIRLIMTLSRILPRIIRSALGRSLNNFYEEHLAIDISEAVPSHFYQEFEQLNFNGNEYNVPIRSELYLAFRYGPNWKIPDENWVTERDDGAYLYNKERNR